MGILSWLTKSAPPDYETLLSRLASDVHDAKVHLSEIRLRERRFSFIIYLYGLALWGVWAGLWWLGGLPFGLIGWDARGNEARLVGFAGLLLGPVLIYGLGRLHRLYFARQRRYEENHLRKLLAEQKKQVDAIKKATNYDATRKLIEEYDVSNGFASPGAGPADGPVTPQGGKAGSRKGTPQKTPAGSPQATGAGAGAMGGVQGPQTPQGQIVRAGQPAVGTPRAPGHLLGAGGTPMPAGMTAEQAALFHFQPQPVLPTPEKRWYDRVVDSILGEDPSHATQSKYALVCEKCFRHNGLVGTKYEWERMQWICPRCNHLNPAPLSRAASDPSHPANLNTPAQQPQPQNRAYPIAAQSPGTPSHPARSTAPQTRARRQLSGLSDGGHGSGSGNGTPRGSRLRQQVMADEEEDEGDDGQVEQQGSKEGEMEVDE